MGNGLSDGSISLVGTTIHKVIHERPKIKALFDFFHGRGVNRDVDVEDVLYHFGLAAVGNNGFGVYAGRINAYLLRDRSNLRLVIGRRSGTYRLTKIL
jgi:hypothetical protein